jgi:transcriptional regulator of acetoin/glycerol metabolism
MDTKAFTTAIHSIECRKEDLRATIDACDTVTKAFRDQMLYGMDQINFGFGHEGDKPKFKSTVHDAVFLRDMAEVIRAEALKRIKALDCEYLDVVASQGLKLSLGR